VSAPIRTLIIDDEEPSRNLLRSMLAQVSELAVVGEAADGAEAVEAIRSLKPALVFLDVQMPELDGFGVLERVGVAQMPAVVFVTAYDRHALKAFDVHAVDFLLKPYDQRRLDKAVQHALARLHEPGAIANQLSAVMEDLRKRRSYSDRLAIRGDGRVRLIDVQTIDWIEAADKILRIHTGKVIVETRASMSAIEIDLDPARFARIHRSIIVNVKRVREIQPWFRNDYVVILADGTKLRTGRAYREEIRRMMHGQLPSR
jgi:two-component system LytT family response regulator